MSMGLTRVLAGATPWTCVGRKQTKRNGGTGGGAEHGRQAGTAWGSWGKAPAAARGRAGDSCRDGAFYLPT